jgi:hypothetical protein
MSMIPDNSQESSTPQDQALQSSQPDTYIALQQWTTPRGGGAAETRFVVIRRKEPEIDMDPLVTVELSWTPEHEPPQLWNIEWTGSLPILVEELPAYLHRYCPAASELLHTLITYLPKEFKSYFVKGGHQP